MGLILIVAGTGAYVWGYISCGGPCTNYFTFSYVYPYRDYSYFLVFFGVISLLLAIIQPIKDKSLDV